MITLPIILLLFLLALKAKPLFQKYSQWLYLCFIALAVISYLNINTLLFTPIKSGYLGLAFFYVVMIVGAMPLKQKQPKENPLRRDYSILGFITITPHALFYITQASNGEIKPAIFGILAYLIMIPLFITSFPIIRHKMREKNWKKLQQFAYLSYLFLFVHLLINSDGINLILYIILFSFYFVLKTIKVIRQKKSLEI
ncbi:MAG: ferric reductase-like transmembrane domain-containing protein [Candidatus Izemoplasmatales bacterium]